MRRLTFKTIGLFGSGIVVALAALATHSQPTATTEQIMRRKLSLAQETLTALVLEDLAAIERNGRALGQLSAASAWNVLRTSEYAERSAAFRRTTGALAKAGQERNLDAASQAYVEMTLQCVQCHKYLRGTRRASIP